MLNILIVILGVATVIGIHEACHMFVSKLFGVKVLKFSLGFGPVIFAKKFGETQYQLSLLPLGGYVQMAGEDPDSNESNGFFSILWYKRALIALAGPVANLILGFLLILAALVLFKGWPILAGLHKAWEISSAVIILTMKWLFGKLPAAQAGQGSGLAGPIMIGKLLISSIKEGLGSFLFLLSLVSLSLGLFNLFPIPGLDGGHLFLYTIEGVLGKKLPGKVYQVWSFVGLILLVTLMLFMCGMDIVSLLK
jgi:membrane-associated protease RseP (regulator of RpoE activity)